MVFAWRNPAFRACQRPAAGVDFPRTCATRGAGWSHVGHGRCHPAAVDSGRPFRRRGLSLRAHLRHADSRPTRRGCGHRPAGSIRPFDFARAFASRSTLSRTGRRHRRALGARGGHARKPLAADADAGRASGWWDANQPSCGSHAAGAAGLQCVARQWRRLTQAVGISLGGAASSSHRCRDGECSYRPRVGGDGSHHAAVGRGGAIAPSGSSALRSSSARVSR